MGDFVKEEVGLLLQQHTAETGQAFTPDAVACIWHLSQGQLVSRGKLTFL